MKFGKFIFITLLVLLSSSAIDTLPGFLDAGEIEPGEEVQLSFYVSINADQPTELEAEYQRPMSSSVWGDRFPLEQSEYSEQSIEDWIDVQDSYLIDPDESVDHSSVNANEEITVTIEVPEDAEPGYHAGQLALGPNIDTDEEGYGTQTYSNSIPEFMFRVPGDADRSIEFADIEAIRTGEDEVQLIKQFENTGTVTTRLREGEASIVDGEGTEVGTVSFRGTTLAPGEFDEVETSWSGAEEGGEYQLEGTADYITGQAYVGWDSSLFAVTGAIRDAVDIEEEDDPIDEAQEDDSRPTWLVIMVLVLIAALLYAINIDPFWIVIVLAALTISSVIIFTGLPNWILLIMVLGIGVLIYV